jgi:hypothetical protein
VIHTAPRAAPQRRMGGGRNRKKGGGAGPGSSNNSSSMATRVAPPAPPDIMAMAKKGDAEEEEEEDVCVICAEPFDSKKRLAAVGPCNHTGVCSLCYLRLRWLMAEHSCVLCKSPMDQMMVAEKDKLMPFGQYEIWGDNAGAAYVFHDIARMFLPKAYHDDFVKDLQKPCCQDRRCLRECGDMRELEKHLREKHERFLCGVCLTHKKVFLTEQKQYTRSELSRHTKKGDALGFFGHPRCEFCNTLHYDKGHLFEHLTKAHFSCHICESHGILNRYYKSYSDLERHFRKEHYLCPERECLEKKFVVFRSDVDFKGHMLTVHPGKKVPRNIEVNFTIRRSNFDGRGAEEDETKAGGAAEDGEMHEWTPEDLLIGMEAEEGQRRSSMDGELDPSISEGAARTMASWVRVGSAAHQRQPQVEDFPALPVAAPARRGGAGGRGSSSQGRRGGPQMQFRDAVSPYPTQAMLLSEDPDPWSYPMPSEPGQELRIGNMKIKMDKGAGKKKKKKKNRGGGGIAAQAMIMPPHPAPVAAVTPVPPASSAPAEESTAEPGSSSKTPQAIIQEIESVLGEEKFASFKESSHAFRAGNLSPKDYFAFAQFILPHDRFHELFANIVRLLPDQGKRAELEAMITSHEPQTSPVNAGTLKPPAPAPAVPARAAAAAPAQAQVQASGAVPLTSMIGGWGTAAAGGGSRRGAGTPKTQEDFPTLSQMKIQSSSPPQAQRSQKSSSKQRSAAPADGVGSWQSVMRSSGGNFSAGRKTGIGVVKFSDRSVAEAANAKLRGNDSAASPPPVDDTSLPTGFVVRKRDDDNEGYGGGRNSR